MSTAHPIPDCYWLVDGLLLAGEYPGAWTRSGAEAKLALFLDAGIRTFIDLTRDSEPLEPYDEVLARLAAERNIDCRYHRLPIDDMGVPSRELMTEILSTIAAELDQSRPVYVHCWGGIGRTGTVAGCWLVNAGLAADEALIKVADLALGNARWMQAFTGDGCAVRLRTRMEEGSVTTPFIPGREADRNRRFDARETIVRPTAGSA